MRASLRALRREVAPPALPLLDARGARVILGAQPATPIAPIAPAADTLFAPRGACLASREGPLIVCDTGHHRLLLWERAPHADAAPADRIFGQPHFEAEGRNAKGEVGPATLNVPTGVAVGAGMLAVADAWNHRVLLWHALPTRSNQPPDVVVGQADLRSGVANRGLGAARRDTLSWPYGVAIDSGRLYVADSGNRRVLAWDSIPVASGTPADRVIDQGLRWPHAIAAAGERVYVADAGLSRVFAWRGGTLVSACGEALNMPYGAAFQGERLVVADTANSRLLGFDGERTAATRLAGQKAFDERGDNRWGRPARDSLCWPYAVSACGNTLVVADTGNDRVLLWDAA